MTKTISPILHRSTIDAIHAGLAGVESDEVQALSEHLYADTDESPYGVWADVTDLYEDEVALIRKALKGSPVELAKFEQSVWEEVTQ